MSIIRSDSRTEVDVRSLTMRMSILSRSDGSGQFSFGDLKALGAVTGPAEVRIRDEKPTEASIEVNVVRSSNQVSSTFDQAVLCAVDLSEKYPRSLIQINLQTLSKPSDRWTNGFSTSSLEDVPVRLFDETQSVTEKAALINAASLALLDAGVGMRGCGFAVGVAIIPASVTKSNNNLDNDNSDHIVLDPNPTEESSAKSLHLIGLHFGHQFNTPSSDGLNVGHVTLCESNGNFSFDQLQTVLKYGSLATQQILEFVRRSCETVYQQHEPDQEENSNPSDPNSSAVNATNENRKKKKVKKTK
ncbi:hypothetical protein KEM48_009162 [Puccinia striiformis f. sp. tritici PST-130]|nr:hypothetical protein KEM48_009162 [Puccinia striiformis f. sp. tritici PST-130]